MAVCCKPQIPSEHSDRPAEVVGFSKLHPPVQEILNVFLARFPEGKPTLRMRSVWIPTAGVQDMLPGEPRDAASSADTGPQRGRGNPVTDPPRLRDLRPARSS